MTTVPSKLGFQSRGQCNADQSTPTCTRSKHRKGTALSVISGNDEPEDLDKQRFEQLLRWLDPDRETAGAKYELIRKRLIKLFVCRGVDVPEELADETINRVTRKVHEICATYVGKPEHYFHGVANNIHLEWIRKKRAQVAPPSPPPVNEDDERRFACLERCVNKLPKADRDLVLGYYQDEKHAKIDHRKQMAEQMGLGMNALRIRLCRIRASLQSCAEQCCNENLTKQNETKHHLY